MRKIASIPTICAMTSMHIKRILLTSMLDNFH